MLLICVNNFKLTLKRYKTSIKYHFRNKIYFKINVTLVIIFYLYYSIINMYMILKNINFT